MIIVGRTMKSFKPCDKCRGKNGSLPEGYIEHIDSSGVKTCIECECHKKWVDEQLCEATFKHSGFNPSLWDYNPRSYVGTASRHDMTRLLNYADQFCKNEKVRSLLVYMYGPNGCQKTVLANYVGKRIIMEGYSSRFILMNTLIGLLQDADFNEDKRLELESINDCDLLIVDEAFDKEKMKLYKSGFQLSFVDTFIRNRVQTLGKGILFISNVHPDNIEKQGLSHSIQDFVQRECKVNNTLLTFKDNYITESHIEYDSTKGLF